MSVSVLGSSIFSGCERLPSEHARKLVMFLHGLGASGEDLIGLAPFYDSAFSDDDLADAIAYISPHAPFACDFSPFGYQWFSMGGYDPGLGNFSAFREHWGDAVSALQDKLGNFIAEQLQRFSLAPSDMVLIGFSQGTMVSLYGSFALTERLGGRFAAVIGYSGAILGDENLRKLSRKEGFSPPPYLLLHGEEDEVVPCVGSVEAAAFLRELGAEVVLQTYAGLGHSINEEGISLGAQFIQKKLAKS